MNRRTESTGLTSQQVIFVRPDTFKDVSDAWICMNPIWKSTCIKTTGSPDVLLTTRTIEQYQNQPNKIDWNARAHFKQSIESAKVIELQQQSAVGLYHWNWCIIGSTADTYRSGRYRCRVEYWQTLYQPRLCKWQNQARKYKAILALTPRITYLAHSLVGLA